MGNSLEGGETFVLCFILRLVEFWIPLRHLIGGGDDNDLGDGNYSRAICDLVVFLMKLKCWSGRSGTFQKKL